MKLRQYETMPLTFTGESLLNFQKRIQDILNKIPTECHDSVVIEGGYNDSYGDIDTYLYFSWEREETLDEKEKRLNQQMRAELQKHYADMELYKKLKKKFEEKE